MSTEVDTIQQAPPAVVALPAPSVAMGPGTDLEAWVNDMKWALALATPMCKTPFVPKAFFNKPEDTAIAIMYGKGLGFDPFTSLSSVFVIGGRPGMYSRDQHALLLAHGHSIEITEQTPERCTVRGMRRGTERWVESVWTIERARVAGYFSNDKYKTDPIAMLTARALGDCCRMVAPDVLKGITAYNEADVELMEVYDGDTLKPLQPSPAPAGPAKVFQRTRPAASLTVVPDAPATTPTPAEHVSDAIAEFTAEPETGPDAPCNTHQQATIANHLTNLGLRTKAAKLAHASEFVGRELPNVAAMTADEADVYINHLLTPQQEPTTTPDDTVDAAWFGTNEEGQ